MPLILTSFLSGMLTILAPCVLPVLPVILGSTAAQPNRRRIGMIIGSFALSVFAFSIILKASTVLIDIHPTFWKGITASILIGFGITTLFPNLWEWFTMKCGLQTKSDALLRQSQQKKGIVADILVGAALGPVFSSCSPTYSLILATIFPVSFGQGAIYLLAYIGGLVCMLFLVARFGYALTKRVRFLTDPRGAQRRGLGIIFVLLGLFIITGYDKKIEAGLLDLGLFDVTKLEQQLLTTPPPLETQRNNGNRSQKHRMSLDGRVIAAPEITGITQWINTNGRPLMLADLKGKVVLIDFWTYSCINCQRTLPYLKKWDAQYHDAGLVILGIHAPEFAFEKLLSNVQRAADVAQISYPVGLDNDFSTWRAYENHYWPAKYFIDRAGNLRHFHFGEGAYEESEAIIRELLREGDVVRLTEPSPTQTRQPSESHILTPETYLGYERGDSLTNASPMVHDTIHIFTHAPRLRTGEWDLDGQWEIARENITSRRDGARLRLRFAAKEVYLVLRADAEKELLIRVDGKLHRKVVVQNATLYTIVSLPQYGDDHLLEIEFPSGVSAHAFTFGG